MGIPLRIRLLRILERGGRACKQRSRIRVLRIVEKYFGGSVLNDAAGVENRDAIGESGEDAGIVSDENERHAALGFKVREELEDFGFGLGVQGSGWFIGDD